MAVLTLQCANVPTEEIELIDGAYKLQITLIHDNTFMLQFPYGCWNFTIGKCAYKLQISLKDGTKIILQISYDCCNFAIMPTNYKLH